VRYPFDCLTELVFVEEEELRPADVILVPGGSHTKPMKIAAELYKNGYAPYILPSGGYNPKIKQTEWEFQRNIAVEQGVPEEAILFEDQAKNTFDNARNSWKVLNDSHIHVNSAILVCKSYFSRRALMTYQTVFPASVQFIVIQDVSRVSRDNWFLDAVKIQLVLNEAGKITRYFGHHIPDWVDKYWER
jgi:uncharacterized SAM-binding protein YcdF (DUF218 family)